MYQFTAPRKEAHVTQVKEAPNVQELLAKAQRPSADAMRLHPFYRGKIETVPKACVRSLDDFSIWYSPGVAAPCRAIQKDPDLVYEHTNKWNTVAVVSDGTRVLGLGDIGPKAGLPVMEGKAFLFKWLGGVDAAPIMIDSKDPDEIIRTTLLIQPAFGGVNLEDLAQPKCFRILDTLREKAEIPMWHDDQQGTACVTVAGLLNALKIVGKPIGEVKIAFIGSGASNVAITRLCFKAGVDPARCFIVDSQGILHRDRQDIFQRRAEFVDKWRLCQTTNAEGRKGGIAEALAGADAVIALSKPGPGTILPEWISGMAADPIVFACANPVPEIWPWEAQAAGARIFATGRSDFPNQVNNSLGFPGIFRGALDVRARTITDEMCIAAAEALADAAPDGGMNPDCILPTMISWEVYVQEAVAVGMKAQEQGIARLTVPAEQLYQQAKAMILRSRRITEVMMETGLIAEPPVDK
jgi:malate dehydrogenase (oxaloacetate-decarboxylating)